MPKLIDCSACGREVSAAAESCPHCGDPMADPGDGVLASLARGVALLAAVLGSLATLTGIGLIGTSWTLGVGFASAGAASLFAGLALNRRFTTRRFIVKAGRTNRRIGAGLALVVGVALAATNPTTDDYRMCLRSG